MSQTAPEIKIPVLPLPINTRRLTIREYTAGDASSVYAYVKEPAYWEFQRSEPPSEEQINSLMQWVVREQSAAPRLLYFLAATRRDSGEVIGEGVLKITNPLERQGELGFGVMQKFWRQGYGTEIGQAMLEAAFGHFKLHRVMGQCTPDNKHSIRVLQKTRNGARGFAARSELWARQMVERCGLQRS